MKVLFAGTPEIAVPSLEKIAEKHEVVGVLTNPDRSSGRGRTPVPSPVKVRALELKLPVFQFESLRREAREILHPLCAEILVVFAYGRIFGPKFLGLFPRGGVNIHPSLLPMYRGSAPLIAPLLNGDSETGITVQKITLELDSGDILMQEIVPISDRLTTKDLSDQAALIGGRLVTKVLDKIEDGTVQSRPQNNMQATYCRKLQKGDGKINWRLPATMIERMVRAYNPWPKAYTYWKGLQIAIRASHVKRAEEIENSDLITEKYTPGMVAGVDKKSGILIRTGRDFLCAEALQLQGKKVLPWKDFLNGTKIIVGSKLGDD